MKNLVAFDFDHTIIELNSDIVVASMIPGGVPDHVKNLYRSNGWTAYMQGVFGVLHSHGFKKESIEKEITKLDPVNGMIDLIKELSSNYSYDVIIISDSNTYFLDTWFKHNNLQDHILRVFTNPAYFDLQGMLRIEPYYYQENCDLSSENLCKGHILEEFINKQRKTGITYGKILYVGDGGNDVCPLMRLRKRDHAFARSGFKLETMVQQVLKGELKSKSGDTYRIKAAVHYWSDAWDILKEVKKIHCWAR